MSITSRGCHLPEDLFTTGCRLCSHTDNPHRVARSRSDGQHSQLVQCACRVRERDFRHHDPFEQCT